MDINQIYKEIIKFIPEENIKLNESMKNHTSFKIGGNADLYVTAGEVAEIKSLISFSQKNDIPLTVVGNGTNILVKDNGIRGITLKPNLKGIDIEKNLVTVAAGESLIRVSNYCAQNGLTGLEFACGIPGTIGGAIKMNAGAYGSEMSNVVYQTTYIDSNGELHTIKKDEHEFGYRESIFFNKKFIIVESKLILDYDNKEKILATMNENNENRKLKQPISMPSAGSSFKRGNGFITAKLIDDAGLKGYSIGDAEVSTKHAGFIVNKGNATANDVLKLIDYIKEKVKHEFDVDIELEIQIMGE